MIFCQFSGLCKKPATKRAHDKRGCRTVCDEHAAFLRRESVMFGHSDSCPERDLKFDEKTHITDLK